MDKSPAGSHQNTDPFETNPKLDITYYTDPLCCWSWAMQPQWSRLQNEYAGQLQFSYRMIGLLPSWDRFTDSLHSLSRPSQMGPEWMQAARICGLPIADKIWVTNPPSSSFPACIAVKCAEEQSPTLGNEYLRAARETIMVDGRNIAQTDVLLDIAAYLATSHPDFDLKRFKSALLGSAGRQLFRRDVQQAQYLGIRRSPTLICKTSETTVILRGYQPWDSLQQTVEKLLKR